MKIAPPKRKVITIIEICVVVFIVLWYFRPYSFSDAMNGLNKENIVKCKAIYSNSYTENNTVKHERITISFDRESDDFNELYSLLDSATYRKKLVNIITGGSNPSGYSIKLNPHADIYFYTDNDFYEYCLFGNMIHAGEAGYNGKIYDYSPKGGNEFQKTVVSFVGNHGIITNKETH